MKAIVRKTWDIVDVKGVPTDKINEYKLIDEKDPTRSYSETEVITEESCHKAMRGLYIAKDRDGNISIFAGKPKKDSFCGIWRGDRVGNLLNSPDNGFILSWSNKEPVRCNLDIRIITDIYRPHSKK